MKNNLNLNNIEFFEGHSQKKQHCYIKSVFDQIGTTNKFYLDIGAYDGITNSNVYDLFKKGWYGLMIDNNLSNNSINLVKETVTKDNIINILRKNNTPTDFDFLSIDIDGMDYWILKSVLCEYRPRLIVVETNVRFETRDSKVLKYREDYSWDGLNWYGASPFAIKKMVNNFEYTPVYLHHDDLFIVRNDCLTEDDLNRCWEDIYKGPNHDLYKDHIKPYQPEPILHPRKEEWQEI